MKPDGNTPRIRLPTNGTHGLERDGFRDYCEAGLLLQELGDNVTMPRLKTTYVCRGGKRARPL